MLMHAHGAHLGCCRARSYLLGISDRLRRAGKHCGTQARPAYKFDWTVNPKRLRICTHPDGSDWILGNGAFGTVYLATLDKLQLVALKVMSMDPSLADTKHFEMEMQVLRAARHRNIVIFVGAYISQVRPTGFHPPIKCFLG